MSVESGDKKRKSPGQPVGRPRKASSTDRFLARFAASIDLRRADAWAGHRAALAAFVQTVVKGNDGAIELQRFIGSPLVQLEYAHTLQSSLADHHEFVAFIEGTALDANREAFVRFAARFPPPLHTMAHRLFLVPLAYRRLCTLAAVHSVGGGYVLSCDQVAEIEELQRRRAQGALD